MRTHTDRDMRILVARSSVGAHHVPLNLRNANLEMATLPHVDLRGANLEGANLRGAMLWGARLDFACLNGADLTCADLTWSSLDGCKMDETLLVEAELDETTVGRGFENAITAGANMITLTDSTMTLEVMTQLAKDMATGLLEVPEEIVRKREAVEQTLLDAHRENAPHSLRMRGAAGWELSRSNPAFAGVWYTYKGEQLSQAQVRVLSDSDLRDLLDWSAATGKPLNLRGCDLSGANLRNALLDGACLACANLTGADIRGASLVGADVKDSCGLPE